MINVGAELECMLSTIGKTTNDIIAFKIGTYKGTSIDLTKLDYDYEDGYGTQHLFGTVLFKNKTWLSRGEYDGSEWWEYNKPPTLKELLS